ncbi:MAG TPA: hypothetical protein VFQ23_22485 [Anaerolineales bacterium]|nr:hypothetical protein [Anaerolineales bacterium]
MFAGHLAVGLVLKKVERRISLAWLFFATLFHDLLLGVFTLLGLEKIIIPANYAQGHFLMFEFPYSHSLAASVVWSLLGFLLTYALLAKWANKERMQAGLAIALSVFSHFVLDWLVHVPDLPLFGADSPKLGLGLWENQPLALTLETALVAIGFIYYLTSIKPQSNLARYGLASLLLFTTGMTVMGMLFATTPPPASGAAMSWILQPFLICGLAYWFDKP